MRIPFFGQLSPTTRCHQKHQKGRQELLQQLDIVNGALLELPVRADSGLSNRQSWERHILPLMHSAFGSLSTKGMHCCSLSGDDDGSVRLTGLPETWLALFSAASRIPEHASPTVAQGVIQHCLWRKGGFGERCCVRHNIDWLWKPLDWSQCSQMASSRLSTYEPTHPFAFVPESQRICQAKRDNLIGPPVMCAGLFVVQLEPTETRKWATAAGWCIGWAGETRGHGIWKTVSEMYATYRDWKHISCCVVVEAISTVACWERAAGQATEAVLQQDAQTRHSLCITLSLHRHRTLVAVAYR